tara:strand:- start:3948 stop:4328 length:381 start_codon:yes stop_codon:yes gene_type:complete
MSKQLTEKQKKFIDALFGEAMGNHRLAMDIAGYSSNTTWRDVTANINEEILQASKEYLSMHAPKAAVAITGIIDDPTELGNRDKLTAAKDVLDRAGVVKQEKIEVNTPSGLFILPSKKEEEEVDGN